MMLAIFCNKKCNPFCLLLKYLIYQLPENLPLAPPSRGHRGAGERPRPVGGRGRPRLARVLVRPPPNAGAPERSAKECRGKVQRSALCRSRRVLSNAYFLAEFGFDTAENEPSKVGRDPVSPDCNRDFVRYPSEET